MKKRLLSLLLAAACLMPQSGCDWGEEPEETYDTLSQYYQQSDSTKQDTRLTTFGLPYLQGETWDPITCADGAQQTLGALLYESLYTLGTDFFAPALLWTDERLLRRRKLRSDRHRALRRHLLRRLGPDGVGRGGCPAVGQGVRAVRPAAGGDGLRVLSGREYPPHLPHPQRPAIRRPAGHSHHQGRHPGGHGTGGQRPLPLCQGRERGVSGPANGLVAG